jgi:hypothetical protein
LQSRATGPGITGRTYIEGRTYILGTGLKAAPISMNV